MIGSDPTFFTVRDHDLEAAKVSFSPQKWTEDNGQVEKPAKLVPSSWGLGVRRTDLVPCGEVRLRLMSPRFVMEIMLIWNNIEALLDCLFLSPFFVDVIIAILIKSKS